MEPTNVRETVKLNIDNWRRVLPDATDETLSDTFVEILSLKKIEQSKTVKKAEDMWRMWRNEASVLFQRTQDYARNDRSIRGYSVRDWEIPRDMLALLSYSYSGGGLYERLRKDGVPLQDESGDPATLLLLKLVNLSGNELQSLENIINTERATLLQKMYAPAQIAAQEYLILRFKDKDPFNPYYVLGLPPDRYLKKLYSSCRLPDNTYFYFAQNWMDSLEPIVSYYVMHEIPNDMSSSVVDVYCRSIDSTIKRKWVSFDNQQLLRDQHIHQFLFEREWISPYVTSVVNKSEKTDEDREMVFYIESIIRLLSAVVRILNSLGYDLNMPVRERLFLLLKNIFENKRFEEW
ncbi:hypothetical protein [Chitinophaga sp. LS1]|uniref:hypothetical protein n=1 Tax=Chitinophaga sp. LS1 TaxID=3051176 RepID=UPI002AAB5E49|nr:hypothetical protein [Chitinophaga sp. LS1]WPV67795.1 hypothetical protein QQL36_03520 [Chitinophaga sp. LS1]